MSEFLTFLTVFVYAAGAVVCHQLPDRSFFWGDWRFPVCARCTGLYLSAVIGVAVWALMRLRQRGRPIRVDPRFAVVLLTVAAVPTLISLASAWVGWWDGTNVWRFVLAVPLGASGGVMVAAVAAKDLR